MTLRTNYSFSFEELTALANAVQMGRNEWQAKHAEVADDFECFVPVNDELELASKVLSGMSSALYAEYLSLPNGNHLKMAYADDVWMLDDSDLEGLKNGTAMNEEGSDELPDAAK